MMRYCLLLILFSFLFSTKTFAQPSNDDPCGAIDIGLLTVGTPKNQTGTNVGATTTKIFSTLQGGINSKYHTADVWYKFRLPAGYYSTKIILTPSSGSNIKFTINTMSKHTCSDYTDMMSDPILQQTGNYYTSTDAIASTSGEILTSIRTFNSCKYVYSSGTYQPGDDIYIVVGGVTSSDQGSFTLSLEPYGLSGGGCPTTSLPCGTVGFNWKSGQTIPAGNNFASCQNTDYQLKADMIATATQYIAPGFDVSGTEGQINLTKIEIDEGATGTFVSTAGQTAMTFCSPDLVYKIRLTGSVTSGGSGVIKLIDHATGAELYSGNFTSGMVITLSAGTIKGKAVFSGPGVSNYKLGNTSYTGSGYGIFNPSKAGNGTHTIRYEWDNGNGPCGFKEFTVTVSGCAQPPCPVDKTFTTVDWNKALPKNGSNDPFTPFPANPTYTCSDGVQKIWKFFDASSSTIPESGPSGEFPGIQLRISGHSQTKTSVLINVDGVDYSYYGPSPAPSNVYDWGALTSDPYDILEYYLPKGRVFKFTICDSRNASQSINYDLFDFSTGSAVLSGVASVKSGSCQSYTYTLSSPTMTWKLDGSTTNITDNNDGSASFDVSKLSPGNHTIDYTFDNGKGCTITATQQKFTVTGGPTATGSLSDVCTGATTTTLTLSNLTGTPTKYSIDWNTAANTAGLSDILDNAIATTSLTIPSNLAAGTYTGSFSAKNASGCSSAAQNITLKVNSLPAILGTSTLCVGDSKADWKPTTGVTWSTSAAAIATIASGATLTGVSAGTATITATDNTTSCKSTKNVTVNAKPTINGTLTVCEGATTTLTGSGTAAASTPWVSATTTNATVSNTGVVTGVAGGNGSSVITYTDNNGCLNTATVTVNPNIAPSVTCGTSTATSVTFNWGAVTGATSYDLVYNNNNAGNQTVTGQTQTSYQLTGMTGGKSATIVVTPKGTGCFKASTIQTCTADNCPSPSITQDPANSSKCAGASTSFSVTATSTAALSYQWQINNGSNPPTNVTNGGVYSGATTSTLSVSDVTGLNGVKYQCLVTETSSGTGCNKTSLPATLTVNPIPSFTPTISDICDGDDPSLSYANLTGSPDKIIFDPGIPLVTPLNLTISASPIVVTGLPLKLPVGTYGGVKVTLQNTTTGCQSSQITLPSFKVQAIQQPSISSKNTDVSSVTFQWSDLTGLNTQTGAKEDSYTVKEFVCNGCSTPGTYVTSTGTLSYNSSTSKWEYLKNGLNPGDRVFIQVTPVDNTPFATPSCYTSSTFDLTAIQCDAPIITTDLVDVTLCEGAPLTPAPASFDLQYNTADATTPATWEILTPGGVWSTLNITGVYSNVGVANVNSTLNISDVKGLDGTKFRVQLKTATVGGSCNTTSKEALLTVKPLPVMNAIADKAFCPNTKVNDPLKPIDFDFKIAQTGTPTYTWTTDAQLTGVAQSNGAIPVNSFASFTTSDPTSEVSSVVTVTPTLNQCVGSPITFKITVKPTVKPVMSASVSSTNGVTFSWTSATIDPDNWQIDTAIVSSTSATTPNLAQYKNGGQLPGSTKTYVINGINSSKKAYINVTPQQSVGNTSLFCPMSAGMFAIPTPCVMPVKPAKPTTTPVCDGDAITVNGVSPDPLASFQWKISTDGGSTWNNVTVSDFGNSGTTNILSTPVTKTYMNNAFVKVVLTDLQTGSCVISSDSVRLIVNELPNVNLVEPLIKSLCVDDPEQTSLVQLTAGDLPAKIDYTFDGVVSKNQDLASTTFTFKTDQAKNYTLSIDKVVDSNGCSTSLTGITTSVTINPNPTPSFVTDTAGCFPFKTTFIDISNEAYSSVNWDFGTGFNSSADPNPTFTYTKEGTYSVTYSVKNQYGCQGEIVKTDYIKVTGKPTAVITADKNTLSVYENDVRFSGLLSKNSSYYKWDFGDNSQTKTDSIVKHSYDQNQPGKFIVTLITSNSLTDLSCSDTAYYTVEMPEEVLYFIPNTFTPNGDEFNNTFQPVFTMGYDPKHYSFAIFDRWGQLVFESKNPSVGWDGTLGDKILNNGTFVWKLGFKERLTDKEHFSTGHVNLVR